MADRSRGITLLEMVVVITILAMMLGLTVVLFKDANRDLGVIAAAHHATALLRLAHQQARSASAPTWVVLNTKENALHLLYKETLGEWHFEDAITTGAFGNNGQVSGGVVVKGRVGQALQFGGTGSVRCGELPIYTRDQGIAVEFWFLRRRAGARQILCTIGRAVEIALEGDGKVAAQVGSLQVSSRDLRVPTDVWCHLHLVHGAGELKLYLNRAAVDARPGAADWSGALPIVVGDARSGLNGIIDEFRVGLIIPRDSFSLPSEAKFEFPAGVAVSSSGEGVIAFDAEGRLDPVRHSQPFRFTIRSPVEKREIVVGTGGTVLR